jgi:hypothetical protein
MEGLGVQVEAHLAQVADRLPWVLDRAGIAGEEADRIAREVRAAGERALRRAERRASRASRLAERRVMRHEAARRREEPVPAAAQAPPGAVEERLTVLRLLNSGKLSKAEADELLEALGMAPQ